jgi:hypothetical protein
MSFWGRIADGFLKNPVAWILLALLGLAEYGSYQRGNELERVCELTGPHDMSFAVPRTPREEVDNICGGRESDAREPD